MDGMSQQPTTKDLRQFGLLVGGVFSVIGSWPVVFRSEPPRLWAMILGGLLIVLGGIVPQSLKQVHSGWMKLGHVLGSNGTGRWTDSDPVKAVRATGRPHRTCLSTRCR